jgi:antitoxin CptB
LDERKKARLAWNCRRGMLELDIILQRFFTNQIDKLSDSQVHSFELLLACNDVELYTWLMGYERPQQMELCEIVDYIRQNHSADPI